MSDDEIPDHSWLDMVMADIQKSLPPRTAVAVITYNVDTCDLHVGRNCDIDLALFVTREAVIRILNGPQATFTVPTSKEKH